MKLKLITGSLAAAAMLAAGCSSSGSGSNNAGGNSPSTTPAGNGTVAISLQNGHLVDGNGRALYTNDKDTASKWGCTGGCLGEWPPVSGTATAGTGLNQSDFGTQARPDGTMQVTYLGKPVYEFADDKSASDTKGDGVNEDGMLWTLSKPGGASGSGTSSSSSSSGGGGYGY